MLRRKVIVAAVLVAVSYFALTWFFFGSPHPCGILEARQRPYAIERERRHRLETYKLIKEQVLTDPRMIEEFTKSIEGADVRAVKLLKQRVWLKTPAQCFWQAITWKAPQQ